MSKTHTTKDRLHICIDELPNGEIRIGIKRVECYMTARESRYADAIRMTLMKELPAICAHVDNRPLPNVRLMPRPPESGSN